MREEKPDYYIWNTTLKTNLILADIYDAISQLNANMIAIAEHKGSKKIKRYSNPFRKDNDKNEKHIGGKGALPPDELHEWFRKQEIVHGRRN